MNARMGIPRGIEGIKEEDIRRWWTGLAEANPTYRAGGVHARALRAGYKADNAVTRASGRRGGSYWNFRN